MGKRSEKKEEIKMRILTGAAEVFDELGFEEATMQDIAKRSEVGLGTAYNYFKSKEELYVFSLTKKINSILELPPSEEFDGGNGVDQVCDEVLKHMGVFRRVPKNVWKTVLGITFNSMKRDQSLLSKLIDADYKAMERLAMLLDRLKEESKLAIDQSGEFLSELIYGAVFFELLLYIFEEERGYQQCIDATCEKIHFILRT